MRERPFGRDRSGRAEHGEDRAIQGLMGLDGASSNQNTTAHDRLALLNSTRERILNQVGDTPIAPHAPVESRRRSLRRTIESVLREGDEPLRYVDIVERVRAVDYQMKPTTVKAALARLASQPESGVERVAWGRYRMLRERP